MVQVHIRQNAHSMKLVNEPFHYQEMSLSWPVSVCILEDESIFWVIATEAFDESDIEFW